MKRRRDNEAPQVTISHGAGDTNPRARGAPGAGRSGPALSSGFMAKQTLNAGGENEV